MSTDTAMITERLRDKGRHLLLALCLFGMPLVAQGHAVLLSHQPASNAMLRDTPDELTLRFNEPVSPVFVRLFDPTGEQPLGDLAPMARDDTVVVELPVELPEGGYLVSWRVISADSHPVGGSYRFQVGTSSIDWGAAEQWAADRESALLRWLHVGNRSLLLISLLLLVGSLLARALLWPTLTSAERQAGLSDRRLLWLGGLLMVTTLAQVVIQGLRMYGSGLTWHSVPEAVGLGLVSSLGQSSLVLLVSVVLLVVVLSLGSLRYKRPGNILATLIGLVALGSLLMTGHIATAPEARWLVPLLAIHLLVAAFWLGAMGPLYRAAVRVDTARWRLLVKRFSALAIVTVPILLLAGLGMALYQVDEAAALLSTGYGRSLLLKIALVMFVLLLALDNRFRLTRQLAAESQGIRQRWQRNLRAESALLLGVVAVTAALSTFMPARSGAHHHDHDHYLPYESMGDIVQRMVDGQMLTLDFQMAHDSVGENQIILAFYDDDQIVRPQEVEVRFNLPELDIEGEWQTLEPVGQLYLQTVSDIMIPGEWIIEVNALVSDFDRDTFRLEDGFY
ncbi:MAG: copper resistance protein CopC/CopD [Natronospirillum sp.]|uniref:copper resistance CopC/CopD family protein n=1 Tax=Natronospirillum sp. TaxID=2812955 RepID=UPI0025DB3DFA|nr:copper resistance protein CopC [Natronospirillum sp.]MCH8552431.1 copper resistance protein CopC/CopD [Natronospirillum sp.]